MEIKIQTLNPEIKITLRNSSVFTSNECIFAWTFDGYSYIFNVLVYVGTLGRFFDLI